MTDRHIEKFVEAIGTIIQPETKLPDEDHDVELVCRCKVTWRGKFGVFVRGKLFSLFRKAHSGPGHGIERRVTNKEGEK